MNDFTENVIYVGVDGSEPATNAAWWAAAEAVRRRAALYLVHGYSLPMVGFAGAVVYPSEIFDSGRDRQQAMLAQTVLTLADAHPGLEVRSLLRYGPAAEVLRAVSANALLTVVGSHGTHQFADSVLGSVAVRAVTHGSGAVVVVRTDPATGTVRGDGPVLVGLDGFGDSENALAFGFEEASLRGSPLVAIHSWDDAALVGFDYATRVAVDSSLVDSEERRLLAEQLAGWADKYPDVQVRALVLRGTPTATLMRYANDDQEGGRPSLLVVGSRGRGGFSGLLLGSTSQSLIAHAPCPVAVVRRPRTE
jgi:nucleotide-binding universal stress UspA family protein